MKILSVLRFPAVVSPALSASANTMVNGGSRWRCSNGLGYYEQHPGQIHHSSNAKVNLLVGEGQSSILNVKLVK